MDLSLLPLVFSLILIVDSRLLHPYRTDEKTYRLVVKRFSTVGTPREVHTVAWRREERGVDRGDQEEKRGNQMGRVQVSQ